MWKTFASLSGIFPLTKPRSRSGSWEPHHKTPTHQFPVLVLCRPREPHPVEWRGGGVQSAAMPPWTGKSVTQSELFTDEGIAPIQMLQSPAFIESQTVEKCNSKTNPVRKTAERLSQSRGRKDWEMSALGFSANVRGSTAIAHNPVRTLVI